MVTLSTEIVRSILYDYGRIYEIITCDKLDNMIIGDVVGLGGAGTVIVTMLMRNIDSIGLRQCDQIALKICKDRLGICSRRNYDNVKYSKMRKEMRVLIANNDLKNFGICGNCNKAYGVIEGCKIMDNEELLNKIAESKEDLEIIKSERMDNIGGIATALEYINGINLYSVGKQGKMDLLQLNKNIIFEMIYACMTTIICLGYIQSDLHSDNIMMQIHDKKSVTYDVYGKKISFTKRLTPYMIDFGAVVFHETRELKMSSVFAWCRELLGFDNATISAIYPQVFNDTNGKKTVEDMMKELPIYFEGEDINESDDVYTFNDEKIMEIANTKELLMKQQGGKKYNLVY